MNRITLFIAILISLISAHSFGLDLSCRYVAPIEMRFLQKHLIYSRLTPNLEKRTIDQYIEHLDGSKMYFTQGDVAKIKSMMKGIFEEVNHEQCQPIVDVYNLFKTRMKDNIEFAEKTLQSKDFKFNPKTELITDPKKRKFGKDETAVDNYMKKYIQLQVANYIATGVKEPKAHEKVLQNYQRAMKRLNEDKPSDILSTYLDSFALALDPHSTYWSPDAFQEFEIQIRLSLEGIGATLSSKDGLTVIEQLLPGGAAAKSGLLKQKDMIVGVGQGENGPIEDVMDEDLRDVVKKIRGKKGTKVRLAILRKTPKGNKKFNVTLTRAEISIQDEAASIDYVNKVYNGKKVKLALVNLPSFYADGTEGGRSSASDMKKLLRQAREKHVDGMVLDLSSDGGGSLQDAVEIAGQFFREGNVVKQSSRDTNKEIVLADRDPLVDYAGPLVILTSRYTASAAEIVSGTLKDYGRAVIVGTDHTFGKGTVQQVEPLPQLGAIKTTIGMFFIPGGESTQRIGVKSDITLPSVLPLEHIAEKELEYALPAKRLAPFLSAEAFVPSGPGAWRHVDKKLIEKLRRDSEIRVAKDPDFKKIRKDIAKEKKNKNGEMLISDFLKDQGKADEEEQKEEGKDYAQTQELHKEAYMKRADIKEALNIAAEMSVLQGYGKAVAHSGTLAKDADAKHAQAD